MQRAKIKTDGTVYAGAGQNAHGRHRLGDLDLRMITVISTEPHRPVPRQAVGSAAPGSRERFQPGSNGYGEASLLVQYVNGREFGLLPARDILGTWEEHRVLAGPRQATDRLAEIVTRAARLGITVGAFGVRPVVGLDALEALLDLAEKAP